MEIVNKKRFIMFVVVSVLVVVGAISMVAVKMGYASMPTVTTPVVETQEPVITLDVKDHPRFQMSKPATQPMVVTGPTKVISRGDNSIYSNEDAMLLAKVIAGEAMGESYSGKLGVATVVLNRMEHGGYGGSTVKSVVFEPGQFDCVFGTSWDMLIPNNDCIRASKQVLVDGYRLFSKEIVYFYNPNTATDVSFISDVEVMLTIGNHNFGTSKRSYK